MRVLKHRDVLCLPRALPLRERREGMEDDMPQTILRKRARNV